MIALQPINFETIQQFFSKFKSLVIQCKQRRIDKKDEQLVLSILSKIGPKILVFVSTFHSRILTTPYWRIPSLDPYTKSLIQEQDKSIQMEALKSSKNQALLDGETKNAQAKGRQKGKYKKNTETKPKEKRNPSYGASGSKKDKHKRFENTKCLYCKRGNHPENLCVKKTIDQMLRLLV